MKKKQIPLSKSNKLLIVYDDLFSYHEQCDWYCFIQNSIYKINGADQFSHLRKSLQLYSCFSEEDVNNMGILKSKGFQQIFEEHQLYNKKVLQTRVNLSPNNERNEVHTDGNGLTLIYYCNLNWQVNWGGHTLFMDDKLSDAEYTCLYKPGRVVVFDGSIPHMILTPTSVAEEHRFSFVMQFEE